MDNEKQLQPFSIGGLEITVTREEILQLRAEAGEAGDEQMILICNKAIEGTKLARVACQFAIQDARDRAEVQS